jgi:hypothetical protein
MYKLQTSRIAATYSIHSNLFNIVTHVTSYDVFNYFINQQEHHNDRTFKEEYPEIEMD